MLTRFCMAQNIRAMMRILPLELQEVGEAFAKAFDSDGRGTLQEEIGSHQNLVATFENTTTPKRLPEDLYELLKKRDQDALPFRHAFIQTHMDYRRKRFSTFSHSRSDSYIVFRDPDDSALYAGRITDIFTQEKFDDDSSVEGKSDEGDRELEYEMFLAVQRFSALGEEDAPHDPYLAQERGIGLGCLCYLQSEEEKILIGVQDIVCHAMCHPNEFPDVSAGAMHVMPLLRVSKLIL